jgi:peptidoglycan/xylan/chitin deacetylase (PgdA/CDA1 family)
MRPPYGSTSQAIVNAVGMPEILWSVDTEDWKYPDSDYVANYVLDHATRGDIVLMHDIHPTSVDAVPRILDGLQAKGYQLVTVDTLLGGTPATGKYFQQDLDN